MGVNLSKVFPDTSADVISHPDAVNELILAICWGGSAYVIGMIFTVVQIVDRWRGPRDDKPTNFFSVLAAAFLAIPWPIALAILAYTNTQLD